MALAFSELGIRSISELSTINDAWIRHEVSTTPIQPYYFLTRDESQRLLEETGKAFSGPYEPEDYSELLFKDALNHPVTVYESRSLDPDANLIQFPAAMTLSETKTRKQTVDHYSETYKRTLELKEAAEESRDCYPTTNSGY
jgi:hypothetical protein